MRRIVVEESGFYWSFPESNPPPSMNSSSPHPSPEKAMNRSSESNRRRLQRILRQMLAARALPKKAA